MSKAKLDLASSTNHDGWMHHTDAYSGLPAQGHAFRDDELERDLFGGVDMKHGALHRIDA